MSSTLSKEVLSKYLNSYLVETGTLHGDVVSLGIDL